MQSTDWWTLGLATFIAALCLVVEHYVIGNKIKLPKEWNYAIGLVTVTGVILAWAAIQQVQVNPLVALAMMAAACIAGVPDFAVIVMERQKERAAWEALIRQNRELAAQLALMKQMGDKGWTRTRDLAETLSFALGAAQQELELLRLFQEQYAPVLGPIVDAMNGGAE